MEYLNHVFYLSNYIWEKGISHPLFHLKIIYFYLYLGPPAEVRTMMDPSGVLKGMQLLWEMPFKQRCGREFSCILHLSLQSLFNIFNALTPARNAIHRNPFMQYKENQCKGKQWI